MQNTYRPYGPIHYLTYHCFWLVIDTKYERCWINTSLSRNQNTIFLLNLCCRSGIPDVGGYNAVLREDPILAVDYITCDSYGTFPDCNVSTSDQCTSIIHLYCSRPTIGTS